MADLSGCGEGVRVCVVRQLSLAAFSFPSPADAPDDMRRHPPAQAPAGACSAVGIAKVEGEMCEVDPAVPGLCKVGPAVTGLCEVDPAVSGLCEVGPAETGLARSASCRSEGGLVLEPGRKGGCALLLGDGRETSGLKVCWHGPRAQWPRAPRPAFVCSAGVEVYLLLFSLSNTITSYGDRYPEGCTEESNFRSSQIQPCRKESRSIEIYCTEPTTPDPSSASPRQIEHWRSTLLADLWRGRL